MRHFLENGVKPLGPGPGIPPLLIALRVGPDHTKLLLEYGALLTHKAILIETDFLISAPMAVIRTLVAAGHKESMSFLRLDESARIIQPRNVKPQRKIQNIKALLRQPRPLGSLARQVVAQCLGPMPGRRRKMPYPEQPRICQEDTCIADRINLWIARIDEKTGEFEITEWHFRHSPMIE